MENYLNSILGGAKKVAKVVAPATYSKASSMYNSMKKPVAPVAQPTTKVTTASPSAVSASTYVAPAVKTPAAQAYVQSKIATPTPTVAQPTQPVVPTPPVAQPAAPTTSTTKDAYIKAYKDYQDRQKQSDEVTKAKQAYNDFMAEQAKSVAGREGRGLGIPLEIVRGEQERLLKQTQPELARLQGDVGIAQDAQTAEIAAAKSGLDMQKDLLGLESEEAKATREASKPIVVDGVAYAQQLDGSLKPLTTKEQEAFNLSEGQSRYAINPTTGQYELVASKGKTYAPKTAPGTVSPYRAEKAINVISQVDEALNMISPYTTGIIGSVSGLIPGTQAKDLQKSIDSIKANIGFDELQAMRDASKTGGALGQVAVQELNSLQATLGSLDRTQSPQALYKNLQDIRDRYSKAAGIVSQIQNQGGGSNIITAPDGQVVQIID